MELKINGKSEAFSGGSVLDLLKVGFRLARGGRGALRKREGLEYWYGPPEPP